MYDFANLLFAGPCSARCYFCIGQQIDPRLNPANLDEFPPARLEALVAAMWEHHIPHLVFSGANTDPQLYRHEARLLNLLRLRLPSGVQFSLHTNGRQAQRKMAVFNQYNRVALSYPSFNPATYRAMMGVAAPPDLAAILQRAAVPVKISCLVDSHNLPELAAFLARCQALGVRRLVLRKLYGEPRAWDELLDLPALGLTERTPYRGNPVYEYAGMEVTLWDFDHTASRSLNLFASGDLSPHYHLAKAQAVR